nr:MAG TPA: hypothetical protein [Caudoviricetes sp.]
MNKIKLNIQRFSGGSYDYEFYRIEDKYVGRMYDLELDQLIKDLVPLLKSLEWWQSCDTSEEVYREDVTKFKDKWFKTKREDRLKKIIDDEVNKTKKELYQLIGVEEIK